MQPTHTLYSPLMRQYKAVSHRDARLVVSFCKTNEVAIAALSGEEYFAIWTDFMDALHAVGDWGYLPAVADEVVYYTIANNIKYYNGEDIYLKALYLKSLSLYYLFGTAQAIAILGELLRLQPTSRRYAVLLRKCYARERSAGVRFLYASAIGLYVLAAVAVLVHVFYIQPFVPMLHAAAVGVQWSLLLGAGAVAGAGWWRHRRMTTRRVQQQQALALARRKAITQGI